MCAFPSLRSEDDLNLVFTDPPSELEAEEAAAGEGGEDGGEIVGIGTPEQLSHIEKSYTGLALKQILSKGSPN